MAAQSVTTCAPPAPSHPHASRYIRFHGREILRGVGFLKGSVIKCPDQHVMNEGPVKLLGDGVLFCDARMGRGQGQCGALIYAQAIPARGDRKHRIWLADCTREEWREIERLCLDADGVLDYFGAHFSR